MNSRVVLILPHPWNNEVNGFYEAGREAAARIMALLVKSHGTFDRVGPDEVIAHRAALPPATVLVKFSDGTAPRFDFVVMPRSRWTRKPVSWGYSHGLQQILCAPTVSP
jgi:hypothetical protein